MKSKSWRDVLKIHPAAELFPLMSEAELKELAANIKVNGVQIPILLWWHDEQCHLVDGRNRLDALELNGYRLVRSGKILWAHLDVPINAVVDVDPWEAAISANIHRRHLTAEQKRELIAKLLKAKPKQSNRQIAKQVKADDKTVAKVRKELEARSEIPNVDTRTDTKGRKQPAERKRASRAGMSEWPAPDAALTEQWADDLPEEAHGLGGDREGRRLRAGYALLARAEEAKETVTIADRLHASDVTEEMSVAAEDAVAAWKHIAAKLKAFQKQ